MKKLVHPLVALMILALGAFIVSPAQAKATYMPTSGATFNDPTGSTVVPGRLDGQIITAVEMFHPAPSFGSGIFRL
jgi:hypothetical protein